MKFHFSKYLFLTLLLSSQTSCIPLAVVGGAGAIGYTAAEERSVGTAIDDVGIETQLKTKLLAQSNRAIFSKVTADSNEGKILLTGSVPDTQAKIKVYNMAAEISGVKQVMNELRIDSDAKFSARQYAADVWISTQIESRLLFTKDVKSINYSVETDEGIVYLMGVAQNRDELSIVTQTAAEVPGVKKVISYVRVKGLPTAVNTGNANESRDTLPAEEYSTAPASYNSEGAGSTGYVPPAAVVIEESPNAQ